MDIDILNESCPIQTPNATLFDFGIFIDALQSGVVESTDFPQKFSYCFWWGLQNLSSLSQNLKTSTFVWEIGFAVFISISGLVLFSFLIGNMQVPMFEKMDEQLYTDNSFIVREGDPVGEMLFIIRGKLLSFTTNGGRTGFFNSDHLKPGDFCGEELLTWALDPNSNTNLPISTRTVEALTEVESFALNYDDLKFVASQFRRLHSKQLRHTFRFYSQQWWTWAACFVQAAWRRYRRKKVKEALWEEESRLRDLVAEGGGRLLPSLGATIYAWRFAANALRGLRRSGSRRGGRVAERVPLLVLRKPAEPDFTDER